jgi:hypothetical protein
MQSIGEMLRRLQAHPEVAGLVEYGAARSTDSNIFGDYDLFVVLEERVPAVRSLHFRLGAVPVDLNVTSLEELATLPRAEGFDAVLLEGRVIHDPSGRVSQALGELQERSDASPPAESPLDITGIRHGPRHILDKVRRRTESMPTLSRYLLHQGVYWLVQQYFLVRNEQFPGDKPAFLTLAEREPALFEQLEGFYATQQLNELTERFEHIAEAVLEPVGGMWRNDEVLTFGDQAAGIALYQRLLERT